MLLQPIDKYLQRVQRYVPFAMDVIPALKKAKNMSEHQIKEKEGRLILERLSASDTVILLDERGKEYSSVQFSAFVEKQMHSSAKQLVFVVGGAYGFSAEVYARATHTIALSKMTFSHQMIRLLFVEQLYRAFSIMRGEPYHHQ